MTAMFAAFAYAAMFVIHIKVGFLTFDVKDAIIAICAMIFGPLAGVAVALLVAFVEMITVSSTGFWGFLMNFISSAVFAAAASTVYRYAPRVKKHLNGAIIGLFCSVLLTTGVMLVLNLLITPIYTGQPVAGIAAMIPTLLLPFNLIKSIMNAALVLVLYKPISSALKKARVIESTGESYKFGKTSVLLAVVGGLIIIGCAAVFILVMGGKFSWI